MALRLRVPMVVLALRSRVAMVVVALRLVVVALRLRVPRLRLCLLHPMQELVRSPFADAQVHHTDHTSLLYDLRDKACEHIDECEVSLQPGVLLWLKTVEYRTP